MKNVICVTCTRTVDWREAHSNCQCIRCYHNQQIDREISDSQTADLNDITTLDGFGA